MNSEQIYFSRINQLLKPFTPNAIVNQEEIDVYSKIKEYLDSLSLDKRKIAVGGDIFIWIFDAFSKQTSTYKTTDGLRYGDFKQESLFLTKNPTNSLYSSPSWNVNFARIMATRSNVTFVNNFHLDMLENIALEQEELDSWNYDVISRQDAEAGNGGPFDFIAINTYDIIHDPSLVLSYFNMLADNGLLLISWANDNGNLYKVDSEYSPYFEINQHLKALENAVVYHDYTTLGSTYAIKL